jgi:hypothetical protein
MNRGRKKIVFSAISGTQSSSLSTDVVLAAYTCCRSFDRRDEIPQSPCNNANRPVAKIPGFKLMVIVPDFLQWVRSMSYIVQSQLATHLYATVEHIKLI